MNVCARMRAHQHYADSLRCLGLHPLSLPGGALALRRAGLTWLPEPATLPDLPLPGHPALLINATDQAMDAALYRAGALALLTPQVHAELALQDASRQRGALGQKWRNRLGRAEAAGLTVTTAPLPRDPGHWLLTAEAAQRRARRYRGLPDALTLAWPQTLLLTALRGRQPVAAALFLIHAPGASYHIGWTAPEGRAACAQHLLLWRAMGLLYADGITTLDLGPVETRHAPGLARFKLGTGALPVSRGHCWLYVRQAAAILRCLR